MEELRNAEINEAEKKKSMKSNTLKSPQIQQKNSIVSLDLSNTSHPSTNQDKESHKSEQKKHTMSLPEDNKENGDATKRSDQSEFVNWEISTVKSGKFFFSQKKKDSIIDEDQIPQIIINVADTSKSEQEGEKNQKQIKNNEERGNLKILKTLSSAKKELLKYFTEELSLVLKGMKPVKMLFMHFCKENNLTSMKSTLFEDKKKVMGEMSLNKWMVFCKEFEVIDKLCLKNVEEINKGDKTEEYLQKEQKKVKALKKAETTLINVFKAVNQNKAKINFDDFVSGLILIYEQFKSIYSYNQEGAKKFLSEVLYCQSQKQCLVKLSSLKFTAGTPKITYEKTTVPPIDVNTLSRSKYRHQKQNNKASAQNIVKVKTSPFVRKDKLNINPVIREAKQTLQIKLKPKYSQHHEKSKAKLVLGSVTNSKDKSSSEHEMFKYFEDTKDPILDSYFMLQKTKHSNRE